ncbi:MAG: alpha/beta hydrolase [Acidobacteriota bacterium]
MKRWLAATLVLTAASSVGAQSEPAQEPSPAQEPAEPSAQQPAAQQSSAQQTGPLAMLAAFSRAQLASQGFERQAAEIAGHEMVWWQKGSGPPMVLIHGVNDQAGTWVQVAGGPTDRYRVLLPDLPGHGESAPFAGPLRMTRVIESFEAWLEQVAGPDGPPPILVGNSMGAWIALVTAHRQPTAVARVVAINGGPLRPDTGGLNLLPEDREQARRLMAAVRDQASPAIPDPLLDDLVLRAGSSPARRMFQAEDDLDSYLLEGRLDEIGTAVDLLWGTSDRYLGEDFAQRLLDGLPRARLTAIETCGHIPQVECPGRFAELLADVLAQAPPGSEQEP